jgi:hypothetical protein
MTAILCDCRNARPPDCHRNGNAARDVANRKIKVELHTAQLEIEVAAPEMNSAHMETKSAHNFALRGQITVRVVKKRPLRFANS